jgi:hypothetical protein
MLLSDIERQSLLQWQVVLKEGKLTTVDESGDPSVLFREWVEGEDPAC